MKKYLMILLALVLFSGCSSKNVKVNFDSNGGSSVNSLKFECDKAVKLPEFPTLEGYIFKGWYDSEDHLFNDGTVITTCEDFSLKAKWEERDKDKILLNFNTDGGSQINSIQFSKGEVISLYDIIPVKEGFIFVGWQDFLGEWLHDTSMVNYNMTVKASWTVMPEYVNVSFDTNGGNKLETIIVEKGSGFMDMVVPYKTGFKFVGWELDGNLITSDTAIVNDCTLVAKWSSDKINFDINGSRSLKPDSKNVVYEIGTNDYINSDDIKWKVNMPKNGSYEIGSYEVASNSRSIALSFNNYAGSDSYNFKIEACVVSMNICKSIDVKVLQYAS